MCRLLCPNKSRSTKKKSLHVLRLHWHAQRENERWRAAVASDDRGADDWRQRLARHVVREGLRGHQARLQPAVRRVGRSEHGRRRTEPPVCRPAMKDANTWRQRPSNLPRNRAVTPVELRRHLRLQRTEHARSTMCRQHSTPRRMLKSSRPSGVSHSHRRVLNPCKRRCASSLSAGRL